MKSILKLSRRQFLVSAAATATFGAGATAVELTKSSNPLFSIRQFSTADPSPILVLLTLYGGNDGLNTIVPFEDSLYTQLRGAMALKDTQVKPLGEDNLWINSSLPNIYQLYKQKKVAIVRGVSYPNPSLSHFVSMAIWQSASPNQELSSGWIGRYLDQTKPTDPMHALCLGSNVPLACMGNITQASAISMVGTPVAPFPGAQTAFSSMMTPKSRTAMPANAAKEGTQLLALDEQLGSLHLSSSTPAETTFTDLGAQLTAVSQLINAGASTRIYSVSESSFDTHSNEVSLQNALLANVDSAIGKFFQSLKASYSKNVTLVAYSEFGRRVASNASMGTDHGTSGPVLLIGGSVIGGMYGEQPPLNHLADGNLETTTDFRTVYATILERILGHNPKDVLNGNFQPLDIISA